MKKLVKELLDTCVPGYIQERKHFKKTLKKIEQLEQLEQRHSKRSKHYKILIAKQMELFASLVVARNLLNDINMQDYQDGINKIIKHLDNEITKNQWLVEEVKIKII
jgi:soluble cytochrome b562